MLGVGVDVAMHVGSAGGAGTISALSPVLWLDMSRSDVIKQDATGTGMPASVGDAVGHVFDLSGAEHDLSAHPVAERPVVALADTGQVLRFDGVDDALQRSDTDLGGVTSATVSVAVTAVQDDRGDLIAFGDYAESGSFAFSRTDQGMRVNRRAESWRSLTVPATGSPSGVLTMVVDLPGRVLRGYWNGALFAEATPPEEHGSFGQDTLRLGRGTDARPALGCDVSEVVIVPRALTPQETAALSGEMMRGLGLRRNVIADPFFVQQRAGADYWDSVSGAQAKHFGTDTSIDLNFLEWTTDAGDGWTTCFYDLTSGPEGSGLPLPSGTHKVRISFWAWSDAGMDLELSLRCRSHDTGTFENQIELNRTFVDNTAAVSQTWQYVEADADLVVPEGQEFNRIVLGSRVLGDAVANAPFATRFSAPTVMLLQG